MNKNDLRYVKTHNLIKNTFLNCVDEIGFEKTTVSDICERALISRKAFYAHYTDKYDLLNGICEDLKQSYIDSLTNELLNEITHFDLMNSVKWNIRIASENRDIIRILLKAPNNQLRDILIDAVVKYPNYLLFENYDEISLDINTQIIFRYMTSAMIGFFEVWLNHYDEISISEAEQLMYDLCYSISKQHQESLFNHPKAIYKKNINLSE